MPTKKKKEKHATLTQCKMKSHCAIWSKESQRVEYKAQTTLIQIMRQ